MIKSLEGAAAECDKSRFDSERIAQMNWIFVFEALIVWLKLHDLQSGGMGGNRRGSKVCIHDRHTSAKYWKQ